MLIEIMSEALEICTDRVIRNTAPRRSNTSGQYGLKSWC